MPFVALNGTTLHYAVHGDPAARPVIAFSNSLGTDFRIWDRVVAALGDRHACVLYDKRGHGLSDHGTAAISIDLMGRDLAALLDHLGIGRAVVCGLSVGGLIAQALVQARPKLVRGLILCDTGLTIGTDALWNARIAAVETGGIESLADGILERWFSAPYRSPDNPDLAGYRAMLVRTPRAGYGALCAAIRDTDYRAAAAAIACPTLCIVGENDGATPPPVVRALADAIPGARFEQIAAAGHLPCLEQPAVMARLIDGFMAGLEQ